MANALTTLETTIATLETALAAGVLNVTVDGETTIFDSEAGLRKRIGYFRDQLQRLKSGAASKPISGAIRISGTGYVAPSKCKT